MPQMTLIVLFSTLSRVIDEQLASNWFANQLRRRRSNRNRIRKHQDENCASELARLGHVGPSGGPYHAGSVRHMLAG
jgi:hypothetical protein